MARAFEDYVLAAMHRYGVVLMEHTTSYGTVEKTIFNEGAVVALAEEVTKAVCEKMGHDLEESAQGDETTRCVRCLLDFPVPPC